MGKISELSDSEFLSFLYSERDRENNLRQYQGWNIWALIGALVTVGCAIYHILCKHADTFSKYQVCYYMSTLLAFIMSFYPLISIILKKDRGVDVRRLKKLGQVAPYYYLGFAVLISFAFSITIPLIDTVSRFNAVSIAWMLAFVLFTVGFISAILNKNVIVSTYSIGPVFAKEKTSHRFMEITAAMMWCIAFFSFGRTPKFEIGNPNLELSVCVSTFILLVYFLIKVVVEEQKANGMDVLIDKYLYLGMSKQKVYEALMHERTGKRVIEHFFKEIDGIQKVVDLYKKNLDEVDEVDRLLSNGKVDKDKIEKCFDTVYDTLSYLREGNGKVRAINVKLKQILDNAPIASGSEEYGVLANLASSVVNSIEQLIDKTEQATLKIGRWFSGNTCKKYGGYCTKDCLHRYENPSLWLRLRWLFYRKKAKRILRKKKLNN